MEPPSGEKRDQLWKEFQGKIGGGKVLVSPKVVAAIVVAALLIMWRW